MSRGLYREAHSAQTGVDRREKTRIRNMIRAERLALTGLPEDATIAQARDKLFSLTELNALRQARIGSEKIVSAEEVIRASMRYEPFCGIYFLIRDYEIVYVGQSINIFARMADHRRSKSFDSFAYLKCCADKDVLDFLESTYIHIFKPRLNICPRTGAKYAPLNLAKTIQVAKEKNYINDIM